MGTSDDPRLRDCEQYLASTIRTPSRHLSISRCGLRKVLFQNADRLPLREPVAAVGETAIRQDQGILFTACATLRSAARKERISRTQQIVDWWGRDFDGVIMLGECHAMQYAAGVKAAA
jgi:hypothetical protein